MNTQIYGPIVINLDRRKDRLAHITRVFSKLDTHFIRLQATDFVDDPAMACHDSHCRALEAFLKTDRQVCFICEDDLEFIVTKDEINTYINSFLDDPESEALCIGCISREHYAYSTQNNRLFYRTTDCQARTAYIIKRSLAKDLLILWRRLYVLRITGSHKNIPNWYSKLFSTCPLKTQPVDIYRGDQCWKILQQSRIFLIPNKWIAIQKASYSDIEQKQVDYYKFLYLNPI